ncbi:RING finger protein vilya [Drosophila grimshawi]|uniref:RING finger protein vilya n=1 Tax=Drosophila grimshawi TaxID=7222 RepID=UPI000C86F128|nr:RING finger protein vilya [Drosophila grimshawi]
MTSATGKCSQVPNNMDTAKKLWIHCNSCFDFYIDQRIIFLLACQHLACEKCVTASIGRKAGDAPSFMCPICGKRVRGRQVNNALPTNLKDMFHPEPWHDGLPHDVIDTFQKDHRKRLEEHIVKKAKEMEKLYKDMQLAYKVCQKQYVELHRNRMARKQLEFRARQIKYQTEIQRMEAQRRQLKQRKLEPSIESSQLTSDIPIYPRYIYSRSRTGSTVPFGISQTGCESLSSDAETKNSTVTSTITGFSHHNNHSFLL